MNKYVRTLCLALYIRNGVDDLKYSWSAHKSKHITVYRHFVFFMAAILKPSKMAGGTQDIKCLHLDSQSGMSSEQYYTTPREPLGVLGDPCGSMDYILEYGDLVWNNCLQYKKDKLEKIQIQAARIAIGATK